ncbi:MAG: hypothetical protein N2515_02730 [Deltaproteobacteria bacterium]|nr:hypothetical protein [Sandaracinaceae bacterium]MCX7807500.1 hypothetical protein [Deltaproteobacteria bacterium]MDW8245128.1 hypothetical protein [Sandaracinaceae bacterium]
MELPGIEHLFFIPAVLLVGFAAGYVVGVRAGREEERRRQKERKR